MMTLYDFIRVMAVLSAEQHAFLRRHREALIERRSFAGEKKVVREQLITLGVLELDPAAAWKVRLTDEFVPLFSKV